MKRLSILILAALTLGIAVRADVPEGYYDRIQGLSGPALKEAVRKSVRFHKKVTYDKLWDAYYDTDVIMVDDEEYWYDMYCNEWKPTANGRWEDPNATTKKVIFNREHCVPNSWWGHANNDCYTDLHHLYIAETKANIAKSNHPMGVVATAAFDNGCLKVGTPVEGYAPGAKKVFEPDDRYKGNFARAYMYVFTVYPDNSWNTTGSSTDEEEGEEEGDVNLCLTMMDLDSWQLLQPWAKTMLVDWSKGDPIDDLEMDRNEAIFELWQFNRNPFIDLPGLEDYIYGDKTEEVYTLPEGMFCDSYHPAGEGTLEEYYNVCGAVDKCREIGKTLSEDYYYVGGYVVRIDEVSTEYGNATWVICDNRDGVGDTMTNYRVKPGTASIYNVQEGDYVVVNAPMQNQTSYNPRTSGGNLVYVGSDVVTGVNTLTADAGSEEYTLFDMQGRRVSTALPGGIYLKAYASGRTAKLLRR